MSSTHRYSLYLLTMSFQPHSQQTNRHLGARLTRIENATKFNKYQEIRQTLSKHLVEFTITKLQEEYSELKELETNYSCSQNFKQVKGKAK